MCPCDPETRHVCEHCRESIEQDMPLLMTGLLPRSYYGEWRVATVLGGA